jgi:uncharacterized membrane protein required for colicin V production
MEEENLANIVTVLAVLLAGANAAGRPLFKSIVQMLTTFVAAVVALRVWPVATILLQKSLVPDVRLAAVLGFWVVYLVFPLSGLTFSGVLSDRGRVQYPKIVDRIGGFFVGALQCAVLMSCVWLTASALLVRYTQFDTDEILLRAHQRPVQAYRFLEQTWGGAVDARYHDETFPETLLKIPAERGMPKMEFPWPKRKVEIKTE